MNCGIYQYVKITSVLTFTYLAVLLRSVSKAKQSSPATRREGAWRERRYSSYSFTTSALDGDEWSASRPVFVQ
jgi:hypothetical protein